MDPRLPSFLVLTGSQELTVRMDHTQWIDPDRALDLLWVMIQPTIAPYLREPLSSTTVARLERDFRFKLLDLVHKGVIWERWGAFGIGSDVTVRIRPCHRGAA